VEGKKLKEGVWGNLRSWFPQGWEEPLVLFERTVEA
jgi:general stress protein 26